MTRKPAVLVTGASREMGHGLITHLAELGRFDILALDIRPLDPKLARHCATTAIGDILDRHLRDRLRSEFEIAVVFHLAALLSTRAEFVPETAGDPGLDANGGLFETLLGEGDAVISDALNHASIIDGVRLCRAQRYRYEHRDVSHLERILEETRGARTRLIATDGVFSMDGDVAPLAEICALAERHGALVMVDNANDVAVMGARPAWFQSTIIVPPCTAPGTVRRIFRDIDRSARGLGIAVTGGHTEVSSAVNQPVVAGDMQGLVSRRGLVTSAGARVGDRIILTKFAGIEGTSIIARRFTGEARKALGARAWHEAARFHHRPGLSVVPEALLAARGGATAMHDPTEGGVAAALFELSTASGKRLVVDLDLIPVHPHTTRLCTHIVDDDTDLNPHCRSTAEAIRSHVSHSRLGERSDRPYPHRVPLPGRNRPRVTRRKRLF
jgi:hydrogenase maturation factor